MGKGGYNGGSTLLNSRGAGFSEHPDFWRGDTAVKRKRTKRKKKSGPHVDRAYAPPPMTVTEQRETEAIMRRMLGPNYDLYMAQQARKRR